MCIEYITEVKLEPELSHHPEHSTIHSKITFKINTLHLKKSRPNNLPKLAHYFLTYFTNSHQTLPKKANYYRDLQEIL